MVDQMRAFDSVDMVPQSKAPVLMRQRESSLGIMDRRQFLASGAASLIGAPGIGRAKNARRVIVVGAGAAGLTAAYHLGRAGVEVTILEAAPVWGGRIARLAGFAGFPIDIGAEWIHARATVLGQIIGRGKTNLGVSTIDYRPQTYQSFDKGVLRDRDPQQFDYAEVKFTTTTWYGFFERFVVPEIGGKMILGAPVTAIDHGARGVSVQVRDGRRFDADQVLVTVPVSMLQNESIRFSPKLSRRVRDGIADIPFGQGFKVFLKFKERFYPDILILGTMKAFLADSWDEKTYYDAAFGKLTKDNVLGLFTAAQGRIARAELGDKEIIKAVLGELDEIYGGVPSRVFENAYVKNWSREPYIRGSYSMEIETDESPSAIFAPIEGRVFFAGEVLGGAEQATVHGAAFSGIRAVKHILDA